MRTLKRYRLFFFAVLTLCLAGSTRGAEGGTPDTSGLRLTFSGWSRNCTSVWRITAAGTEEYSQTDLVTIRLDLTSDKNYVVSQLPDDPAHPAAQFTKIADESGRNLADGALTQGFRPASGRSKRSEEYQLGTVEITGFQKPAAQIRRLSELDGSCSFYISPAGGGSGPTERTPVRIPIAVKFPDDIGPMPGSIAKNNEPPQPLAARQAPELSFQPRLILLADTWNGSLRGEKWAVRDRQAVDLSFAIRNDASSAGPSLIPTNGALEQVLLHQAVDDTGRDLLDLTKTQPLLSINAKGGEAFLQLHLQLPDPKAKTIACVKGQLSLTGTPKTFRKEFPLSDIQPGAVLDLGNSYHLEVRTIAEKEFGFRTNLLPMQNGRAGIYDATGKLLTATDIHNDRNTGIRNPPGGDKFVIEYKTENLHFEITNVKLPTRPVASPGPSPGV